MTTLKPPNGARGWIALALIVLGGSTGGSYLRPAPAPPAPPPHNPAITTEAWVQVTQDVKFLREKVLVLDVKLDAIVLRLPPQPPREQP